MSSRSYAHTDPSLPRACSRHDARVSGSARAQSNGTRPPLAQTAADGAMNRLLASDMSQPSERLPQGVPTWYDWAGHPRVHPVAAPGSFRAFTAWGQLYQCAGTSPSPQELVQLRNLQSWVLPRRSSRWRRIQFSSAMQGAAFAEDYDGPTVPAHYVVKASGTPSDRWRVTTSISGPAPAARVCVPCRSPRSWLPWRPVCRRDPGPPAPCLVLSVGGDLWRSLRAGPGTGNTADIGIGRFKRVERRWRLFTMTTASTTSWTRPTAERCPRGRGLLVPSPGRLSDYLLSATTARRSHQARAPPGREAAPAEEAEQRAKSGDFAACSKTGVRACSRTAYPASASVAKAVSRVK